jgi:DNA-binding HxlR family transcriptional regulator
MAKTRSPQKKDPPLDLARLFHHRWAVPVIAELERGRGAKFITLVKRLGVGRDTLSRTLKALDDADLAMRNPGYGHPMRPEYILTEAGHRIGPPSVSLMDGLTARDLVAVGLKKWSMPTAAAIGEGERRFSELASALPGSTPRALTATLKELTDAGLVQRELHDDYPPRTTYRLTGTGAALLPSLGALEEQLVVVQA